MRKRYRHLLVWLGVSVVATAIVVPPALAKPHKGSSFDYTTNAGLSAPIHETFRESHRVPVDKGVDLYVEVVRPVTAGRFPVIVELTPYNGNGDARDAGTLAQGNGRYISVMDYFAPRGYAVATVDLRGTGRSGGCLDMLAQNDAADIRTVIEWLADRPWSSGRVGAIGHSYPGMAATVAAAQEPRGLVTSVPIAAGASMYDNQFQAGVPYGYQWTSHVHAYPTIATQRHLPSIAPVLSGLGLDYESPIGDDFGGHPQDAACGWMSSSLTTGDSLLSGAYTDWHRVRDFHHEARDSDIPVFLVQGLGDGHVRIPSARWFFERDASQDDKLWLGQWGHSVVLRAPQFTYALHAWFDHHLQQRKVDTGPSTEVFMNDSPTFKEAGFTNQEVYVAERWKQPASELVFHPSGECSLDEGSGVPQRRCTLERSEVPGGQVSFVADPLDGATNAGTGADPDDQFVASDVTGNVTFISAPVEQDTLFLGEPSLDLVASVSTPRAHLIATLYDKAPSGQLRRMTTFAINPELRNGLDRPFPAIPGQKMSLDPPGFHMAHHLRAGHQLVLRLTGSNQDKIATFAANPRVTVFLGPGGTQLRLPVVPDAVTIPDVLAPQD